MTMPTEAERGAHLAPVGCHCRQPAARARLVTFPHAGGAPLTFQSWAHGLAPDVELWHVTLPGRAGRRHEPFARDWEPLVDALAVAISRDVPRPVALFGHSLGALLAFEVARRLTVDQVPPLRLIVSGCAAPDRHPWLEVPETDDELLRHVEFMGGAVPAAVRASPELLEHFLPILRADLELARAYVLRPLAKLTCPITAMTGDADPIAPASAMDGWRAQTDARCEVWVLPGGHLHLVDQTSAILAKLRTHLIG